jgi:hypothetical protein
MILFIWLINTVAHVLYWYSAMWWFDIPMHILGGMFLALLAGALFFKQMVSLSAREQLVTILLFVLIVGLGWELYEYVVQAFVKDVVIAGIPDSIKDMVMDLLGGLITSVFVLRTVKRYNTAHAKQLER